MKDASIQTIMIVDDTSVIQENNESESTMQDCKHEMTDQCTEKPLDQLIGEMPDNTFPEPRYYRLDRVVFAEPIEVSQSAEESGTQSEGVITFIDNIMVKKRTGKRNRYFIDIKDGCLDCPVSNCSQSFSTKTLLKAHVRKVHCATTTHVCEECGGGFTAAYLLRRHSAVHSGAGAECGVCCRRLSQRTDLSAHMKTHNAARQHECAACGKRFLRRSSLRRHENFVHRDGPMACLVCDAKFTSRKLFTLHRATHATQPCGVCGVVVPRNTRHRH